ncbi:unnamed protein product [Prorocentrum cordatum]|uniref:Protein NLRC3 n=1 Tax=Prorocentrum cordatum TaxID=2364126 RepID=A0ABN9S0N7_9DINO|nr:unnamed protein product [Polarella glacialis]
MPSDQERVVQGFRALDPEGTGAVPRAAFELVWLKVLGDSTDLREALGVGAPGVGDNAVRYEEFFEWIYSGGPAAAEQGETTATSTAPLLSKPESVACDVYVLSAEQPSQRGQPSRQEGAFGPENPHSTGHKQYTMELVYASSGDWKEHCRRIEVEFWQRFKRPFFCTAHLLELVQEETWVADSGGNKIDGLLCEWTNGELNVSLEEHDSVDSDTFPASYTWYSEDSDVCCLPDSAFPVTLHISLQEKQQGADMFRYTEGEDVFDTLAAKVDGHHPVRLLRMSWLLQTGEQVLKRRQELPERAFISAEELHDVWEKGGRGGADKVLPIVTISFCWDTREHPDPTGQQLKRIVDTLNVEKEKYVRSGGFSEMGIFWDWASLLQGDLEKVREAKGAALAAGKSEEDAETAGWDAFRTPDEKAAFGHALRQTMDLWYAHQGTTVFLLTQHPRERGSQRPTGYDESGWPTYERCSAEQIKNFNRKDAEWDAVLDLGSGGGAQASGRRWPVGPDDFDSMIETRSFKNGSDRDAVKGLFWKMSVAQLGSVRELDFLGMPRPEPADMARLGRCLLLCASLQQLDLSSLGGRCLSDTANPGLPPPCLRELAAPLAAAPRSPLPALRELCLNDNCAGDAGAVALAGALPAAPALQVLRLGSNAIGDAGAEELARALPAAQALQVLGLGGNAIGDAGAVALARALAALPALWELDLSWNAIGDAGAEELARALPAAPTLQTLELHGNDIDDDGGMALAAAWAPRSKNGFKLGNEGGEAFIDL